MVLYETDEGPNIRDLREETVDPRHPAYDIRVLRFVPRPGFCSEELLVVFGPYPVTLRPNFNSSKNYAPEVAWNTARESASKIAKPVTNFIKWKK